MASHPYPTVVGSVQLVGTAKGIAIEGPGGRVLLSNRMLSTLAEFSVTLLDVLSHDPDREPNGDELDGANSEDEFMLHSLWQGGAGCPIADPPEEDDHSGGNVTDEPHDACLEDGL
jgi:hypothetical protein